MTNQSVTPLDYVESVDLRIKHEVRIKELEAQRDALLAAAQAALPLLSAVADKAVREQVRAAISKATGA